jgi:hypothetical protein
MAIWRVGELVFLKVDIDSEQRSNRDRNGKTVFERCGQASQRLVL